MYYQSYGQCVTRSKYNFTDVAQILEKILISPKFKWVINSRVKNAFKAHAETCSLNMFDLSRLMLFNVVRIPAQTYVRALRLRYFCLVT